jgi:hypothetical protein
MPLTNVNAEMLDLLLQHNAVVDDQHGKALSNFCCSRKVHMSRASKLAVCRVLVNHAAVANDDSSSNTTETLLQSTLELALDEIIRFVKILIEARMVPTSRVLSRNSRSRKGMHSSIVCTAWSRSICPKTR